MHKQQLKLILHNLYHHLDATQFHPLVDTLLTASKHPKNQNNKSFHVDDCLAFGRICLYSLLYRHGIKELSLFHLECASLRV